MKNVLDNVKEYFNKHLPQYEVLNVTPKSYHPDDSYLYMVSAKHKTNNTFAVWTSWNESIQSLNGGIYDLQSEEECEEIFKEYYFKGE